MNTIQYQPCSFTHNNQQISFNGGDKSNNNAVIYGSGGAAATFATLRKSSTLGKRFVEAIESSKVIKATKKAQVLEVLGKFKPLAKYMNSPVVKGAAGVAATAFAGVALLSSVVKIADTCSYLQGQNA